ncbi:MAG: CrcB family protein [Actinomycetota bacterium]|nr:CrcB family protein [Actinomycetota bacterium]
MASTGGGSRPSSRVSPAVIGVVAAGGAIGSVARYVLAQLWSSPWAIVVINVVGSLLLGLLMGVLSQGSSNPLLRPFVGVGVLGGFTTFSTAMVDLRSQLTAGHPAVTLLLLLVAAVGSILAAGWGWHISSAAEPEWKPQ